MKHLIVTLFSLMVCTTLFAYDAEIDGIYYNFSGDEAEVTFQKVGENQVPMSDYSASIVIPESVVYNEKSYKVTSIGRQAFMGCSALTSIIVPESVTSIGVGAFYGCSSLTSITIPDGITCLEERVFYGCVNLVSVNLPDNITTIKEYAFFQCSSLSYINIPISVTRIDSNAFSMCSSLTSFTIPEGIRGISKAVFSDCRSLATIVIPESVVYIEWFAFDGCTGLTSILCNAQKPPSVGEFSFYDVDKQNCKLYVPKGCEEAYRNAEEWKDFNIIEMEMGNSEVKNERVNAEGVASKKRERSGKSEKYDDAIYDFSGQKVRSQLKKGIYIQNGVKQVVR